MTITLPKTLILFLPAVRRGGYEQQKPVRGRKRGPYHLATRFNPDSVIAVSLCRRAAINQTEGYWFLVNYEDLVECDESFTELICQRCRKMLF